MVLYIQASLSTVHRSEKQTLGVLPLNEAEDAVDFEHCLWYHNWEARATAITATGKPWQKQWGNAAAMAGKWQPQQRSQKWQHKVSEK